MEHGDEKDRQASGNPEKLFLEHLEVIDRATRYACGRGSMRDEDAEDFASYVKLKLIEKDYAVIRKYERRSSFAAFISVVVQRLLLDYRIGQWGKWHASAEAKRIGELAITIEAMLHRDGRTVEEVLPTLIRRWPDVTRASIEALVRRLPSRAARVRVVELEEAGDALASVATQEEPATFESERTELAQRIATIVRHTVKDLDVPDRLIFRLRFEGGMSVADVSRALRIEQKPLYRRLQRVLLLLRKRLQAAGVSATDAEYVLMSRSADLDFGFDAAALVPHTPADEEES